MQWRVLLFFTGLVFFSVSLQAQNPLYPKNYFRNPLAIPMELSANFGELRPNHWHMGLDIRTDQKENLPVYAAADGYIAAIGVRPQSFGRFIIINHPNGLSTLYGHLNDFFPELEQYVTQQQYTKESWSIELNFDKNIFPVGKGKFIAFSGNTGGSQGPHLHFEIFNTKTTKRFNPLLFGFPITDNVPPNLVKLAMYDRSKSVYEQTPVIFYLKNTDSGYIIPKQPLLKTGLNKISFAIQAYDRLSGSTNPNGIYSAKLSVDDEPQIKFVIDSIDYYETAYMNAHIDYKYRKNGGSFLQHLSQLPGDMGVVYKKIKNDGVILLSDTTIHQVSIELKDANNNTSQINFSIQYIDSLDIGVTLEKNQFFPNRVNELKKPDFEIYMPDNSLYDSIQPFYFYNNRVLPNAVSALHQLNDASFPLHNDITVRIKPNKQITDEWKNKLVMRRSSNGNSIKKAELTNGWLVTKFDDFGNFQAFTDLTPPQINELGRGDTVNLSAASRILFTPTDNFGIKSFRAELNGKWVRFTNDKSRNWIYQFDERCPFGVHELKITAEDIVGNITTKSWWFKRYPYTPPPPKKKAVKKLSKKQTEKKKKAPVTKKMTSKKKK
ncbi:MAG: peptidoglycan DD-metalloendopeptidase family protein [Chitinophagaceae bacterium]